jgi:hypothetical protein
MNDRKREQIALLALEHQREMQALMGNELGPAREAFLELYTWVPEWIENEALDAHLKKAYHENGAEEGEIPPFLCNLSVFEMLGKEQSRTFGALLRILGEALGLTDLDMRRAMNQSGMNEEEQEKKAKPTADSPLTEDDFDALQIMLMDRARYDHGQDVTVARRMLRALKATREVHAAPQDPNRKFMRVLPKDLRIGDQICRWGRWLEVRGFFLHEPDKRWTDEGMTRSEVPVGGGDLDFKDEPTEYFVDTDGSSSGDLLRSRDEVLIRRLKTPDGEPPAKKKDAA